MKKTLFVALMVVAGLAQAGEINLDCEYNGANGYKHKVSIDPQTRSAVFGDIGIFEVTAGQTQYILRRTEIKRTSGIVVRSDSVISLNRADLSFTSVDTVAAGGGTGHDMATKGQCSVSKAPKNLI